MKFADVAGAVSLGIAIGIATFDPAIESMALTLTSPIDGTVVGSGEKVAVAVQAGDMADLREVRYFWFRLGEEVVAARQAKPAEFRPAEPKQPVDGVVIVPDDALGTMRLLAVGEVVKGRLAGHQDFDEVIVRVEPEGRLAAIDFAADQPWRLDTLGQRLSLPVVGRFEDGVVRPLDGAGAGSRFQSSDERVVQVDQAGQVTVAGRGHAVLTVVNRGTEGRIEVIVDAAEESNRPPVAIVPLALKAKPGSVVSLDGRRSFDPDGDPLRYEWKQTRGMRVDLTSPGEVSASFVAPLVSARRLLQFQLNVTDLKGPDTVRGAESVPATVQVWVEP